VASVGSFLSYINDARSHEPKVYVIIIVAITLQVLDCTRQNRGISSGCGKY